jgi:hypothetical protein
VGGGDQFLPAIQGRAPEALRVACGATIDSGRIAADIIGAMKRILPLVLLAFILPRGIAPALAQSEPFRVTNGAPVPAVALHAVRSGRPTGAATC